MLVEMVNVLMIAEVDAVCGASYRERSDERGNQRNGYRECAWDTRLGTIGLKIPKLRQGSYFPAWLLEPRRRAGKALTAVVAEACLLGVSTRKVEDLVETLGVEKMSKSQVSELAKELDGVVKSFRDLESLAEPNSFVIAGGRRSIRHKYRGLAFALVGSDRARVPVPANVPPVFQRPGMLHRCGSKLVRNS